MSDRNGLKTSCMEAALGLARRGWHVFPCRPRGKRPWTPNGFLDATVDEHVIERWWREKCDANIGIWAGASGLLVIDIDGDKGREGLQLLEDELGALPQTVSATTGHGAHYYFREVEGVGPSAGKLAPGVDIRAGGSYIVAPPSMHPTGRSYVWLNSPRQTPVATLPPRWRGRLQSIRQPNKARRPHKDQSIAGSEDVTLARAALGALAPSRVDAYETWTQVGMALNSVSNDLLADYIEFSRRSAKYKEGEPEDKWNSFNGEGVTIGTLYLMADEDHPGWRNAAEASSRRGAKSVALSDTGNAERFRMLHGDRFRFCKETNSWYVWTGDRWKKDTTKEAEKAIKTTIRAIPSEAHGVSDEEQRRRILTHALKSESASRRTGALKCAEAELAIAASDFDCEKNTLNLRNGMLRLGELREAELPQLHPHDPTDLITRIGNARYDPKARAPRWEVFVDRISGGDQDLCDFLQRLAGYTILGDNPERKIVLLYGPRGGEGKTVLVEALGEPLGDYAAVGDISAFEEQRRGGASPNVVRLQGRRFVRSSEISESVRLDQAQVKRLCGNDTITARDLYSSTVEYRPEFVFWLPTNHLPDVSGGGDSAFWERVIVLPFRCPVPLCERRPMGELLAEFRQEADGILLWILKGLRAYFETGLALPPCVTDATQDYRSDSDLVSGFFAERTVQDGSARIARNALYAAYRQWAEENSPNSVMSSRTFGRRAANHPHVQNGGRDAQGRYWRGVRIV